MGIDPKNHRLHHSLPHNSTGATSLGQKLVDMNEPAVKPRGDDIYQASDAGSCWDDEPCRLLPDLNLDLTMSIPSSSSSSPSLANKANKEKKNDSELPNLNQQGLSASSATLVLFQ